MRKILRGCLQYTGSLIDTETLCKPVEYTEERIDRVALAERLYQKGTVSLGKAAKIAGMTYVLFSEHLSKLGIPVIDYSTDDLEEELRIAKR
jgi:predicted HTH domain antitoxin